MSYILDALQKKQAEQNTQGISVRTDAQPTARRVATPTWMALFSVILALNLAVLLWFIFSNASSPDIDMQLATTPVKGNEVAVSHDLSTPPETTTLQPMVTTSAQKDQPQPAPEEQGTEVASQKEMPVLVSSTNIEKVAPAVGVSQPLSLSDLSATERALYEGFNYTSHIYTNSEDLRAVVIDGQRVQIGDRFNGLKIHDITETGVIFEDSRGGDIRRIQVNPFS